MELEEYCRKKGLYREQIESWKSVCLKENAQAFDHTKQLNGVLKEEQSPPHLKIELYPLPFSIDWQQYSLH